MKLYFDRSFYTEESVEVLANRLEVWARKDGFVCTREELGNWEYRRGTHLRASVSWNVRHLPTVVTVLVSGASPCKVDCSMLAKSWAHIETPRDKQNMEGQVNTLVSDLQASVKDNPEAQDVSSVLRDLKSLLDDGVISEEEFSRKKQDLLNRV